MMNFDYLKDIAHLRKLYEYCSTAEMNQQAHPDVSAIHARRALEWIALAIYQMKGVEVSERTGLFNLLEGAPFKEFVGDYKLMMAAHYVRKVGNKGAHTGEVSGGESFFALLNIYNVVGGILKKLRVVDDFPAFNRDFIPRRTEMHVSPLPMVVPTQEETAHIHIEKAREEPVETRPTDLTEAETRRLFIDMMLEEAGWKVLDKKGLVAPGKACIEVEVTGMPNNEGTGFADYVLFGSDGKPLAVVEAKRTSVDPQKGRHQAELYADCLEREYHVRPVIYYSNGYKTEIIDGLGYPPRTVFGFHSEEELMLLIQHRGRHKLDALKIKDDITNREYQKRAIRKVCDHLSKMRRRSLLVMATGTGKTRVAISLTEVLTRSQWVKNVLFLADRTALVNQAAKNFAKLLPQQTLCVLSEERAPDMNARIMLSTYQTMIGKIDSDTKSFTIGRFDLIIVDEAHRSVFGKYTSIFNYFDGFLVGLTATPREEIEHNTFDLFGTEAEDTFAYELDEAVTDHFLVPYKTLTRNTRMLKEGIKYDELDAEGRLMMEPVWEYEKARKALDPSTEYARDIENDELFKYIYNLDTIDRVLQDLMKSGLKVESGEKIGKTIIFARDHHHAELIVERFGTLYPELGSDYCVLIDNTVNYAQDLINKFEVRGGMPQIAVSVDMMDTGIDVPDILNLVFFKPVFSKIKFMQMIGRGTRLSPDIFGPGKDKKEFYIFDWCGNFEFFKGNPKGATPVDTVSLSERLFCLKTDIAAMLQHATYQAQPFTKSLHDRLKAELHGQIAALNDNLIAVRENWELVDKYRKAESWTCLMSVDVVDIKNRLSPIIIKGVKDENAAKFDLLMFFIELSLLEPEKKADRQKKKVTAAAEILQEKGSIPQVQAKMGIIHEVLRPAFWENATMDTLERVRTELRELMKFLAGQQNKTFTLDIDDEVVETGEGETYTPTSYKQRVIDYLAEHRNLPVLRKIMNVEQLTRGDIDELEQVMWKELGTKQDYLNYVKDHNMACGESVAAFIRMQIGVDRDEVLHRFSKFLSDHTLNADQEDYLRSILDYVCLNGDITVDIVTNEPPFCDYNWSVFGNETMFVGDFVNKLHDVITA